MTIDRDIRHFMDTVNAGYAAHTQPAPWNATEARRIAELVRAPWREGGPTMAETHERTVPCEHASVRVRVHVPDLSEPRPALVYMHGGGWTVFSIDTHDRVMREYAARANIVVVGVDYALSPEVKFPVALEQVVAVVRWLSTGAAGLGIDSRQIAVGGDSAGANLAVSACLKLRDDGEPTLLKAMLLNYGCFMVEPTHKLAEHYGQDYMLTREEMAFFWANYLQDERGAFDPLVSPLLARLDELPPAFMTIPEHDVLTEQSWLMRQRLRDAGVPVRAELYAGATHSFLEAVSISQISARALQDGADWLRRTLRSA